MTTETMAPFPRAAGDILVALGAEQSFRLDHGEGFTQARISAGWLKINVEGSWELRVGPDFDRVARHGEIPLSCYVPSETEPDLMLCDVFAAADAIRDAL